MEFKKAKSLFFKEKIIKRISDEKIRRVLLYRGLRFRKAKRKLVSPNCLVFFEDEKRIVAKEYAGYEWCLKAKLIPINQRIKGKATIYMLYNPKTKEIYRKYLNDLKKESF